MAKLTTYIKSEDARTQAEFYTQALGGEILSIVTHGQMQGAQEGWEDKVVHLSLLAGGITFLMSDSMFEPLVRGNTVTINLEFGTNQEAQEAFERLSEGGRIRHPLTPAFWGALFGELEDKFGTLWMITTEAQAAGA
ncbi:MULTISPECIES: VOC family protein [unclassified Paenibacillus]|uniref:VOC family protein n=1 Tax=unclassified Paenibacillus TaxID=185978 RepID=UPI0009315DD7|nr:MULTISPECIES: VOC family protein [unclassified Paenibacillus]